MILKTALAIDSAELREIILAACNDTSLRWARHLTIRENSTNPMQPITAQWNCKSDYGDDVALLPAPDLQAALDKLAESYASDLASIVSGFDDRQAGEIFAQLYLFGYLAYDPQP